MDRRLSFAWIRRPAGAAVVVLALVCGRASAAEVTRVVTGMDDESRFDFHLSLGFRHDSKTAAIKREFQSQFTPGRTEIVRDLVYTQTRNTLDFRADIGLLPGFGVHVLAPLVLSDDRGLDFDQRGGGCIFPGDASGARPTCVNQFNSPLLRDGILPGAGQDMWGYDVGHGRPFQKGETGVFRGPTRSGLEYLDVGFAWALLDQAKDDTKPTWLVGFDARLSVGSEMKYDPSRPAADKSIGLGYHQLVFSTVLSKRFKYLDPYWGGWAALPVRTSNSIFRDLPGQRSSKLPQTRAGVQFGFEQIAWEDVKAKQKVSWELRAHAEAVFEGRGYSELWEPLAGSSLCKTDPTQCRADIDKDIDYDGKADPYPGITDIETYATAGGDLGLNVQVGKYVRFRGLFGMSFEQPHFITFADAGVDKNKDGRVDTSGPTEGNPAFREIFDLPGRRYRVEESRLWSLLLFASLMF